MSRFDLAPPPKTADEFETYSLLEENSDRLIEWINGEVVEAMSPYYAAVLGAKLQYYVGDHIRANQLGHALAAGCAYRIGNDRYVPNFSFVSYARWPEVPRNVYYNDLAPDLVFDTVTYLDQPQHVRRKLANYLRMGTTVWIVEVDEQYIEVYAPGEEVRVYYAANGDVLEGGKVLPGFRLELTKVFGV